MKLVEKQNTFDSCNILIFIDLAVDCNKTEYPLSNIKMEKRLEGASTII